jgi:hypothetical protein
MVTGYGSYSSTSPLRGKNRPPLLESLARYSLLATRYTYTFKRMKNLVASNAKQVII